MASIGEVINVQLILEGQAAQRDNMNVCCVMTSEQGNVLSSANRYERYLSLDGVAEDFGTNSKIYDHATKFFSQSPNAVQADGAFIAGFWRGVDEDIAASAGYLTGGQLTEETVIDQLLEISDGSFNITIDGGTETVVTGVDFRTVIDLDDVAELIEDELTGATVSVSDDNRIIITSDTTGATSTVTFLSEGASGTFVGDLLKLADGTGAIETDGAAAETLSAETYVEALTAVYAQVKFKGVVFTGAIADVDLKLIAAWAQANSVLFYYVFNSASNLEVDVSNVVWDIKLSKYTNTRCLHHVYNDKTFATAYMARAHTVLFTGTNTAITMNLKELVGITPYDYSDTDIAKAQRVGLDVYTTFKDVTRVLSSGANDFWDNRYNLIAYIDAVQTDLFNFLATTGTKVPQTVQGVNSLVDAAEKTTEQFVSAGVFAAGTWTLPETFGNAEQFYTSIETKGYYWYANPLSEQSTADRQARKSPVLQNAVKNAGAIHKADIIINWNI